MIIIKYLKKLDYQRKKNRYLRERIAQATHLKKASWKIFFTYFFIFKKIGTSENELPRQRT
jgi:hypothetical protein